MRLENIENAYERLKDLTRGKNFNKKQYLEFVENLDVTQKNKDYLKSPKSEKLYWSCSKT